MSNNKLKALALIPARGGSKRLPRKNVLPFLGRPLIAYTIEAALKTNLFERVVVSTDDQEIADTAKSAGAEISLRDPALATDTAMVRQVALDFLEQEEKQGNSYDLLCVLYATAPLRRAEDIIATYNLIDDKCHHALAVTEYDMPPHQALKKTSDKGDLSPMWPEIVAERADNLPEMLVDNGSTYCVMVKDFRETISFYADNMRGHLMPKWKSVDIDTEENFELLKFYAEKYGEAA